MILRTLASGAVGAVEGPSSRRAEEFPVTTRITVILKAVPKSWKGLLSERKTPQSLGQNSVIFIIMLLRFRKHETENVFQNAYDSFVTMETK